MNTDRKILAWSRAPEPDGSLYAAADLTNTKIVAELFESCKVADAYINADGWEFLFETYGADRLLEIDTESHWFDSSGNTPQLADLVYQALISGYNPLDKEKGDYDVETSSFLSLNGYKRKIDWSSIAK